jgi:glycosyltransferase involved in cell wall biosynthesis
VEFGQEFAWDIPLLDGYGYEFIHNVSFRPGVSNGFWGVWMRGFSNRLRDFRPNAVMLLGWQLLYYWQAALCTKLMGIPYIVRGESNLLRQGSSIRWGIKNLTIGQLCRNALSCLAIGTRNVELYKAYGVPDSKIRTAPYFVDNERFVDLAKRLKPKRDQLRIAFGLPRESTVFLFVGKLIHKKHPDSLLRAYLTLPPEIQKKASLLLVGDGAIREALEEMAQGHPNICFTGFLNQSRIPEAYSASDVLVLPSDAGETWGLVVNEAMASGLPAIVTDHVGCAPDLVLEHKTGFVVPLGDVEKLKHTMHLLIEQPDMISRLGRAATIHIKGFSIKGAVKQLLEALEEV